MKGAIARAEEIVAETAGRVDAAAVRESGQSRGPPPHDRAGNPRRLPRRAVRRADHRRRHRRPHHRPAPRCSRRNGRTSRCSRSSRRCRRSCPAASPARTRSRASAPASSRRSSTLSLLDGMIQVDPERRQGNGAPRRARGRPAGRHFVRRDARRDRAEAAGTRREAARSSASTTTPASAISRSRTSCPKKAGKAPLTSFVRPRR